MSEQIKIAGRQITCKGLTMAQIRKVMDELQEMSKGNEKAHIVDLIYNDDVPALAIAASTGLSMEELAGEIGQQDMHDLIDKVRSVNPFFVGAMERLISPVIPSSPSPMESVS